MSELSTCLAEARRYGACDDAATRYALERVIRNYRSNA